MKKNQNLTFSHYYSKFNKNKFTTIRRHNHGYKVGKNLNIVVKGKMLGVAKIIFMHVTELENIKTEFLLQDTDKKSRKEAIALLNSFYQKPIQDEELLIILILEWVWKYSKLILQ